MTAADFSALSHLFSVGFRQERGSLATLCGGVTMLWLLIAMWGFLWAQVDPQMLARHGLNAATMIWYFAMAETVVFAAGHFHAPVIADVREGRVGDSLTRPMAYPLTVLAEAAGGCAFRFPLFFAAAATGAFAMTEINPLPQGGAALALMPFSMVAGCAIWLLLMFMIGLAALWLSIAEPLFWIAQKLLFLFGGLVVPLSAIPEALRILGWFSPFPAILYAPAGLVSGKSLAEAAGTIAIQFLWLALAVCFTALLWRAAVRKIMREGG